MIPGSDSILVTFANGIVRKKLNSFFEKPGMTEDNLVRAIRNNTSLWEENEDAIQKEANTIPPMFMSIAKDYVEMVNTKMGGFTTLTLFWLREDKPSFYSVIINSDGGKEWLERQVNDILKGIGIIE